MLTRHVGFTGAILHIFQHPALTALRHQFPAKNTILGQIHIGRENIGMLAMQHLAFEVLTERSMASLVIEQCVIPICTQGAWQDGDIAKDTLQWFVQDIRHFVFEVLGGHEGVEQVDSPLALHCLDLTTGTCNIGIGVKGLPKMVK